MSDDLRRGRTTEVVVRTAVWGEHRWPTAPPERAYLGTAHRHRFEIEYSLPVDDDDRQVEFHDLLDAVNDRIRIVGRLMLTYGTDVYDFDDQSCETIAWSLINAVAVTLNQPRAGHTCSVFEDGICGARVRAT